MSLVIMRIVVKRRWCGTDRVVGGIEGSYPVVDNNGQRWYTSIRVPAIADTRYQRNLPQQVPGSLTGAIIDQASMKLGI